MRAELGTTSVGYYWLQVKTGSHSKACNEQQVMIEGVKDKTLQGELNGKTQASDT